MVAQLRSLGLCDEVELGKNLFVDGVLARTDKHQHKEYQATMHFHREDYLAVFLLAQMK